MNARIVTKKVVNIAVTTVVSFSASNVIASNAYPKNKIQKIEILAGSMLIGMFVSEKLGEWSDVKVDALFDWYETTFSKTTH